MRMDVAVCAVARLAARLSVDALVLLSRAKELA